MGKKETCKHNDWRATTNSRGEITGWYCTKCRHTEKVEAKEETRQGMPPGLPPF